MKRFQTRVPGSLQKVRLDHFLAEWLPQVLSESISNSVVRTLIATGSVYVNRHRNQNATTPIFPGAMIEVYYNEDRLKRPGRIVNVRFDASKIIFEDEWLIVVNKPSGLPTQPTLDPARPNLFGALKNLLVHREKNPEVYLGLHHRIDRDTSGLVLFTKKNEANKGVADLFSKHQIEKVYQALTWRTPGSPGYQTSDQFFIENRLAKVGERNSKALYGEVKNGGDLAFTDFRILESFRDAYWIEAKPKTGRTHQIRAHLSESGLPIFGDELYFPEGVAPLHSPPRLMLHAGSLKFIHPLTGETRCVEAPMPDEFVNYLTLFKA